MARIKLPNIINWVSLEEITDRAKRTGFYQHFHVLREPVREWCAEEFDFVPLINIDRLHERIGTRFRYYLEFENDYHAVLFTLRWM